METFREGDFIRLRTPEKYQIKRVQGSKVNIFTIREIKSSFIEIFDCKEPIPMSDIEPIPINGKDDVGIYFYPTIKASVLGPNERPPIREFDGSYYYDYFKKCFHMGKNLQEHIKGRGLQYVHEVQHYLDNEFNEKGLEFDAY